LTCHPRVKQPEATKSGITGEPGALDAPGGCARARKTVQRATLAEMAT